MPGRCYADRMGQCILRSKARKDAARDRSPVAWLAAGFTWVSKCLSLGVHGVRGLPAPVAHPVTEPPASSGMQRHAAASDIAARRAVRQIAELLGRRSLGFTTPERAVVSREIGAHQAD